MQLHDKDIEWSQAHYNDGVVLSTATVWAKVPSTAPLYDGREVEIGFSVVSGKRQYDTALGGTKTVFVLEKPNKENVIKIMQEKLSNK